MHTGVISLLAYCVALCLVLCATCHMTAHVWCSRAPSQCYFMGVLYTVERIVKHRQLGDGTFEFYVKWQGYDDGHNSWEPKDHFLDPTVLRSYAEKSSIDIDIDDDNEPKYEVDKVLDFRTAEGGRLEYQILWEAGDTTWEPAEDYPPSDWDEVKDFWASRGEDPPPAALAIAKSSGGAAAASSSALAIPGSSSGSDHHTLSRRTWDRYKTYAGRMKVRGAPYSSLSPPPLSPPLSSPPPLPPLPPPSSLPPSSLPPSSLPPSSSYFLVRLPHSHASP